VAEILSVEGLTAGYNGKPVIDGVTFALSDGDVMAVVGPNGSGKTTLIRAVLSMMPARGGKVRLFGRERLSPAEAGELIAYIPQRLEVDRTFPISLREMLALSAPGAAARDRYTDMLELRGLLSKKVGELSGGEMQRALLAYGIMKEPRLLVMDEPTSWVDVKGADCVLCIMEEFRKKGMAMIIVSHDFSVIRAVANKVLGLGHGSHFFLDAESPELDGRLMGLFGTMHHSDVCCPPLPRRKG